MKELKYNNFNSADYTLHSILDGFVYYVPDDESRYIKVVDGGRERVISTGFYEMEDFGFNSDYNIMYDKTDDTYKHRFEL